MRATSDEEKQKMMEILKRVYENDKEDEEERVLAEKLDDLDLGSFSLHSFDALVIL